MILDGLNFVVESKYGVYGRVFSGGESNGGIGKAVS